jgi:hypothetical protein
MFRLLGAAVFGWVPIGFGRWAAFAIAVAAVVVWYATNGRFPPTPHRQIAKSLLDNYGTLGVAFFGLQLGTGVVTYVPLPTSSAVALILLLGGLPTSVVLALAIGFGLGRAAQAILRSLVKDPSAFDVALEFQLRRWAPMYISVALIAMLAFALLRP